MRMQRLAMMNHCRKLFLIQENQMRNCHFQRMSSREVWQRICVLFYVCAASEPLHSVKDIIFEASSLVGCSTV
jgi:hypothetical protein